MKTNLLFILIFALFLNFTANATIPTKKGSWKFDDAADMLKAAIGSPLVLTGIQTSVAGPVAGNLATEVPLGNSLAMTHGIAPNGGGTLVNEWTLQIDFAVAQTETWYAFFQTLDGDADLFVAKSAASGREVNTIGTAQTGYTTNAIVANKWYRMIVSVKNGTSFKIYIDGVNWLDVAGGTGVDGRYALQPTLQLFQDDDGDDGTIKCAEVAIWDVALTDAQALELGTAITIPTFAETQMTGNTSTLGQNYPNPFSASTIFPYQIKETGNVNFRVFDLTGKEINSINAGKKTPGEYKLEIQSQNLKNGIYYLQMITNEDVSTQKMIVSK